MLKHMDFILEENEERKKKLRFYPKQSSLHLFDSGLEKEQSEPTFEDVYKIYYCWSILQSDNDYDIDINESGNIKKISDDWSSFKQIFGFWCDECSALSGIGDLTRHIIHTHVTSLGDRKRLMQGLNTKDKDLELAVIAFPEILLGIDEKVSTIIERWIEMDVQEGYKKAVAERELVLCQEMEGYTDDKRFIYRFITIPFNEKEYALYHMWQSMYKCELKGEPYPISESIPPVTDELEALELNYLVCDLLYGYASRFGYPEHIEDIQNRKTELSKKIASELSKKKLTERRCKHCGKVMRWNYPYSMCNSCHDTLYPRYYKNDDNDYYDDDDFIS